MHNHSQHIIIHGMTPTGKAFRPSDWAERLCGIMATFDCDDRLQYSDLAQPLQLDGIPCVAVAPELERYAPDAYDYLLGFARDNGLNIVFPAQAVCAA